jgi:hypothetical protein
MCTATSMHVEKKKLVECLECDAAGWFVYLLFDDATCSSEYCVEEW